LDSPHDLRELRDTPVPGRRGRQSRVERAQPIRGRVRQGGFCRVAHWRDASPQRWQDGAPPRRRLPAIDAREADVEASLRPRTGPTCRRKACDPHGDPHGTPTATPRTRFTAL
jgi:hypothetical protein